MKREKTTQERTIRLYFRRTNVKPFFIIALGLAIAVLGVNDPNAVLIGVTIAALGALIVVFSVIIPASRKPSDTQIDAWLKEGMQHLQEVAYRKTGIDRDMVVALQGPLVVRGPILWNTVGIKKEDLTWKKGRDNLVRFGVYRVTIILLTENQLCSYSCDYNFIKDVPLNDRTDEYHYRDVVSVATREQSTSLTLPTGQKMTHAEEFRLTVSSGDSIAVLINTPELKKITGVETLPDSGVEQSISVIRAKLRDKKV
jgi:hypothetical protein